MALYLKRIAWTNVGVGFIIWWFLVVGSAILMPTLYRLIVVDTGWAQSSVALHSSIKLFVGAAVGMFAGYIIERLSLRVHLSLAALCSGAGYITVAVGDSMAAYYLSAALIGIGVVNGAVGAKVLVARWFSYRLGFVIGIAMLGAAGAGLTVPVGGQMLAAEAGWRMAAATYGVIVCLVLLPLLWFVAEPHPRVFKKTAEDLDPGRPGSAEWMKSLQQPTFAEQLQNSRFWLAVVLVAVAGGVDFGLTEHTPLYVSREAGLGDMAGALGIGGVMIFGGLGKLLFGWLCDRISMKGVAACWALLSIGVLLAFPVAGMISLTIFTFIRGLAHGGAQLDYAIIAKHVFGNRTLARNLGIFSAAHAFGGAIFSGLVAYGQEITGSYVMPFIGLAILGFICAAVILTFPTPFWRTPARARAAEAAAA